MTNKEYNNFINAVSFLATLGVPVCKFMGWSDCSWLYMFIPIVIAIVFQAPSDEALEKEMMKLKDKTNII